MAALISREDVNETPVHTAQRLRAAGQGKSLHTRLSGVDFL